MKFSEEIEPDSISIPDCKIPTPTNFLEEYDEPHFRLSRKASDDKFGGFSMGTFMLTIVACLCLFGGVSYMNSGSGTTQPQINPTASKFKLFTTFTPVEPQSSSSYSFLYLLPLVCLIIFTLGYGVRAMLKDFFPTKKKHSRKQPHQHFEP